MNRIASPRSGSIALPSSSIASLKSSRAPPSYSSYSLSKLYLSSPSSSSPQQKQRLLLFTAPSQLPSFINRSFSTSLLLKTNNNNSNNNTTENTTKSSYNKEEWNRSIQRIEEQLRAVQAQKNTGQLPSLVRELYAALEAASTHQEANTQCRGNYFLIDE